MQGCSCYRKSEHGTCSKLDTYLDYNFTNGEIMRSNSVSGLEWCHPDVLLPVPFQHALVVSACTGEDILVLDFSFLVGCGRLVIKEKLQLPNPLDEEGCQSLGRECQNGSLTSLEV